LHKADFNQGDEGQDEVVDSIKHFKSGSHSESIGYLDWTPLTITISSRFKFLRPTSL